MAALALRPDAVVVRNNLGLSLEKQGKLSAAIDCFREAVRLKPDYVKPHVNLISALRKQGKLAEAEAAYRETIKLDLKEPDRADLREEVLEWLRAEVAALSKRLVGGKPADRSAVVDKIRQWDQDKYLTEARAGIDKLPEKERTAWRKVWQDVEALRKQAAPK